MTVTAPTDAPTTTGAPLVPALSMRFGQRCYGATLSALKPAKPVDYLELRMDSRTPRRPLAASPRSSAVGPRG